jgi:hypothetical protein
MELSPDFLVSWLVGVPLTALTFVLTRSLPWRARANLRSLVVAASFTPSIALAPHNVGLAPAIFALVLAPFYPM